MMPLRTLLWAGTVIDAVLLIPAFYMAIAAAEIASATDGSPLAVVIAVLFFALPVFCIAAPFAAWRAHAHQRGTATSITLLGAPMVYAAFLVFFLFG